MTTAMNGSADDTPAARDNGAVNPERATPTSQRPATGPHRRVEDRLDRDIDLAG